MRLDEVDTARCKVLGEDEGMIGVLVAAPSRLARSIAYGMGCEAVDDVGTVNSVMAVLGFIGLPVRGDRPTVGVLNGEEQEAARLQDPMSSFSAAPSSPTCSSTWLHTTRSYEESARSIAWRSVSCRRRRSKPRSGRTRRGPRRGRC